MRRLAGGVAAVSGATAILNIGDFIVV